MVVIPSLTQTLKSSVPAGEDWNRHSIWIERYISGDFTPIDEYPPMFELFMIPFYIITGYPNIRFFQPLFAFLSIFAIISLAKKTMNMDGVLFSSLIVSTSYDFVVYAGSLLPQTLDYIFLPVSIILFFEKKYTKTAFIIWFLLGTHNFGVFIYIMFFIYSYLVDKEFLKYLVIVAIFGLVFLPSFLQMTNVISTGGRWENEEMVFKVSFFDRFQLWTTPWDDFLMYPMEHFITFSGFLLWFLLPLTLWSMKKNPYYDKYQLFYVIWFFVIIPLVFFNTLRWWSYSIVPASLFCGSVIGNYLKNNKNN